MCVDRWARDIGEAITGTGKSRRLMWRNVCLSATVKFTLVQALRLCTGCAAHRVSRVIALLFLDHGTRSG